MVNTSRQVKILGTDQESINGARLLSKWAIIFGSGVFLCASDSLLSLLNYFLTRFRAAWNWDINSSVWWFLPWQAEWENKYFTLLFNFILHILRFSWFILTQNFDLLKKIEIAIFSIQVCNFQYFCWLVFLIHLTLDTWTPNYSILVELNWHQSLTFFVYEIAI